jgi:hypothetical protein
LSKHSIHIFDKKEEDVFAIEQAMFSRVQEQKDSAIASMFEPFHVVFEELFVTQ